LCKRNDGFSGNDGDCGYDAGGEDDISDCNYVNMYFDFAVGDDRDCGDDGDYSGGDGCFNDNGDNDDNNGADGERCDDVVVYE
jgi:hypothetical protein